MSNNNDNISKRDLGIYIHIPFCVRKCNYCDFLSFAADDDCKEKYVRKLLEEIALYKNTQTTDAYLVKSIFIGGGTPSILESSQTERIMDKLKEIFSIDTDTEITMEMNPGTVTREKLDTYNRIGINRISIGLQSTNDAELRQIGRIHTFQEFLNTFYAARRAGFANINIDIMAALPDQTYESYRKTLMDVVTLKPEHISAYSLIIEENTPFYVWNQKNLLHLPSEDLDRKMYDLTGQMLEENGYERYEISNYAKLGYRSRHNSVYWRRGAYLGLGIGAASFMNEIRWTNDKSLYKYVNDTLALSDLRVDCEVLTTNDQMEEFMFLGLRMMEGVLNSTFKKKFHVSIRDVYQEVIEYLLKNKLISETFENQDVRYTLTRKGIDISNYVYSKFIL